MLCKVSVPGEQVVSEINVKKTCQVWNIIRLTWGEIFKYSDSIPHSVLYTYSFICSGQPHADTTRQRIPVMPLKINLIA